MHTFLSLLFAALYWFLPLFKLNWQGDEPPAGAIHIDSPQPGEALQGKISIVGTTLVEGFVAAEIDFGYLDDPTGTWFLIAEDIPALENANLAEWDTFTLTDGNYTLRLVITLVDGEKLVSTVKGVRVRNYSAIETNTPTLTPTASQTPTPNLTARPLATSTMAFTPSATPIPPTATPLPPNPARLSMRRIADGFLQGAAGTLAVFLLLGLYTSLRTGRRK